jgi:lysophospholipase L1-like esterase
MPLGASITWGLASTDGNGYRNDLRQQLVSHGNPVKMAGSRQHGLMKDNDVEGWPGFVIEQVHAKATKSVPNWKPNVILVNAGTNDCAQNRNVSSTGMRTESMLDDLFQMSPRTTIILSSLIVNKNPAIEAHVLNVNQQFSAVAQKMRANGKALVFADMHGDDGPQLSDLSDGTHPTDVGYAKMANIWYSALVAASDEGFLQQAEQVPGIPDDGGS